jgi:hypothetical protein
VKLSRILLTRGGCLSTVASEVEGLKVELASSWSTVGELRVELDACKKHTSELEQEHAKSSGEALRLEQEFREANTSRVRLTAENERHASKANNAILAMVAARSELKKLSVSQTFDVGRYLPLFLVKMKIKKISIIILEERCLIRILSVLRQWKYKRKDCHDSR